MEPCITRLGTWLDAADFHFKSYEKVTNFIHQCTSSESAAKTKLEKILNEKKIIQENELLDVQRLVRLSALIVPLQKRDVTVSDQWKVIEDAKALLRDWPTYSKKLDDSLAKNPDLLTLVTHNFDTLKDKFNFKFCPLVSGEVERSFSMYNSMLSSNRLSLKEINANHLLFLKFNSK